VTQLEELEAAIAILSEHIQAAALADQVLVDETGVDFTAIDPLDHMLRVSAPTVLEVLHAARRLADPDGTLTGTAMGRATYELTTAIHTGHTTTQP
jgi:hypothetical protein